MLLSAGIGITPIQGLTNQLLHAFDDLNIVFVWTLRDRFLISSVLEYDEKYATRHLKHNLPMSFQPDLVSDNTINNGSPAKLPGDMKNNRMHSYFHLTHPRAKESFEADNVHPINQKNVIYGRPKLESYFK